MLPTIKDLIENREFSNKAKRQLRQFIKKYERPNTPPQPLLNELSELHEKEMNSDYKSKIYLLIEVLKEKPLDDGDIDLTYMPGMCDTSITKRENEGGYYY